MLWKLSTGNTQMKAYQMHVFASQRRSDYDWGVEGDKQESRGHSEASCSQSGKTDGGLDIG